YRGRKLVVLSHFGKYCNQHLFPVQHPIQAVYRQSEIALAFGKAENFTIYKQNRWVRMADDQVVARVAREIELKVNGYRIGIIALYIGKGSFIIVEKPLRAEIRHRLKIIAIARKCKCLQQYQEKCNLTSHDQNLPV